MCIRDRVHAFGGEAAHVLKVDVVLLHPDENVLLQQIAAVIAADGNFHGVFSSYNSLNSGFPPVKAVSYTHLDVYKRQAMEFIKSACEDAYDRLIYPSLEREARSDLTERACEGAIQRCV